ncbi:MAG: hypothetical protein R2877_06385 [Bdellovibrionota bacterium]
MLNTYKQKFYPTFRSSADAVQDENEVFEDHLFIVPSLIQESFVLDSTSGGHGFTYPVYQSMMKDVRSKHSKFPLISNKKTMASLMQIWKTNQNIDGQHGLAEKQTRLKAGIMQCQILLMEEMEKCIQMAGSNIFFD